MVINPRPPICIREIMTTCPKVLQYVPVSSIMSPVTQVALTAVNMDVLTEVKLPFADETGRQRSRVPSKISAVNPRRII